MSLLNLLSCRRVSWTVILMCSVAWNQEVREPGAHKVQVSGQSIAQVGFEDIPWLLHQLCRPSSLDLRPYGWWGYGETGVVTKEGPLLIVSPEYNTFFLNGG